MNFNEKPPEDQCHREAGRRKTISLDCEVRQGTRPWKRALLEDLSRTGFRIAWLPATSPHVPLRVRIPGMQVLTAQVRWKDNEAVGCEFAAPLHIAVFEHLVRMANAR